MPHEQLSKVLGQQYEELLLRQAETIRDWPSGSERHAQAENHVRLALWEQQMGRISDETRIRCYSILHFVMPNDASYDDERVPLAELEPEAEHEAAYFEQLDRMSCRECGDGRIS